MKFCKIILIIFLVCKSIVQVAKTLLKDDLTFEDFLACLVGVSIAWALYWGAGILDV